MREVSDEDINRRIAEFMEWFNFSVLEGGTVVASHSQHIGIAKTAQIRTPDFTSSLDSLIPVVDQVLFKLKTSVWVEPSMGISSVVFNSWIKRIGEHPRINAMTDYSPSRALSLAIFNVLGER